MHSLTNKNCEIVWAKTERFQTEGEYSAAALNSMRQLICFSSIIRPCKPILVLTQNEIMSMSWKLS